MLTTIYKPHGTLTQAKRSICPEGVGSPHRVWQGWGPHFLHCSLLPGDSLRPSRGGAQSGSWVQGPRAPLTCGFGQVSVHASHYLLLTRACDEGTIFIPNLQQRELRPGEGELLTRGHTGVTEQQVLNPNPSFPGGCLLLQEAALQDFSSLAPPHTLVYTKLQLGLLPLVPCTCFLITATGLPP